MKRKWERPAYAIATKEERADISQKPMTKKHEALEKTFYQSPRLFSIISDLSNCRGSERGVEGGRGRERGRGRRKREFAPFVVVFSAFLLTVFLSYYQLFIIRMEKNFSDPPH